ncbi:hypothetical protein P8452_66015 [Trifolium repens]|nr:hypothetical protein P8452_66015 [Trifolium repens]
MVGPSQPCSIGNDSQRRVVDHSPLPLYNYVDISLSLSLFILKNLAVSHRDLLLSSLDHDGATLCFSISPRTAAFTSTCYFLINLNPRH